MPRKLHHANDAPVVKTALEKFFKPKGIDMDAPKFYVVVIFGHAYDIEINTELIPKCNAIYRTLKANPPVKRIFGQMKQCHAEFLYVSLDDNEGAQKSIESQVKFHTVPFHDNLRTVLIQKCLESPDENCTLVLDYHRTMLQGGGKDTTKVIIKDTDEGKNFPYENVTEAGGTNIVLCLAGCSVM
mmetsp:Transcript_16668/g.27720  ORF Transcript_16668/g.27720 Transcript_16668/m.27720 type:complete len:185 (-) Transcript_16668:586-1140(-)